MEVDRDAKLTDPDSRRFGVFPACEALRASEDGLTRENVDSVRAEPSSNTSLQNRPLGGSGAKPWTNNSI